MRHASGPLLGWKRFSLKISVLKWKLGIVKIHILEMQVKIKNMIEVLYANLGSEVENQHNEYPKSWSVNKNQIHGRSFKSLQTFYTQITFVLGELV